MTRRALARRDLPPLSPSLEARVLQASRRQIDAVTNGWIRQRRCNNLPSTCSGGAQNEKHRIDSFADGGRSDSPDGRRPAQAGKPDNRDGDHQGRDRQDRRHDATTGGPIAGAVVSINGRYRATTDNSGNHSVAGLLDAGSNTDITYVSAENYVSDYRYIQGRTVQNVRLHRIERIVAGESKLVTIAPDDTLCVNNVQDTPGIGPDYVCRSVFVVAPNAGAVTIEAVSTRDGAHAPLEVETVGVSPCCSERMGNPTTIHVTAGTVIVVNVEMLSSSTSTQSFVVSTSPSPQ